MRISYYRILCRDPATEAFQNEEKTARDLKDGEGTEEVESDEDRRGLTRNARLQRTSYQKFFPASEQNKFQLSPNSCFTHPGCVKRKQGNTQNLINHLSISFLHPTLSIYYAQWFCLICLYDWNNTSFHFICNSLLQVDFCQFCFVSLFLIKSIYTDR